MSANKSKNPAAEAAEEIKTDAATKEAAEKTENSAIREQTQEGYRFPDPCVYCGPSVRGVARQYTVYHGGIPNALQTFVDEHPRARALIVSLDRFANMRQRLETHGTAESVIFRKIRSEI